jgi:hypothetical protein
VTPPLEVVGGGVAPVLGVLGGVFGAAGAVVAGALLPPPLVTLPGEDGGVVAPAGVFVARVAPPVFVSGVAPVVPVVLVVPEVGDVAVAPVAPVLVVAPDGLGRFGLMPAASCL